MPFIIKVSYSGQIRRINFPKFPDFQLFHTRLVELFGEIPGGYRVLNLISANGLPICDVAEHEGDWASASANFTNALKNVTTLLKCSIEPVLNSPREYVEAIAAAKAASLGSASAASCCAVEEGKREMKDLLENFLKDFQRSYGETFGDELNDVLSAPQPAPTQAPAPAPAPAPVPVPVPIPVAPTSTRRESRQGPFTAFSAVPALNAAPMMARPARPPRPEEGVLHPNIWCDRCGEHIRGIRFKCNDCPDYDLCSKCTMNHDADTIHCAAFDHSFKMITSPEPTGPASIFPRARRPTRPQANSSTAPIVHHRITCDGCNIGPIIGVRHKCLDCPDFDFCDRCKTEDTTHDPEHEFLPLLQPGRVVIHDRTRVPRRNAPVIPPAPTAPAPVPETTSAPRARTAHNATCNLCASRIYGIRYKCANCPDYDVCESCFRITEDQHPTHTFVKVTQLTDIVYCHTRKNSVRHRAVCDGPGCRKTIVGIRYKCMHPSCADFDLCEDCESLPIPVHPIDHPMLKMRTLKARVPSLVANPVVPTVLPHTRAEPIIQIPLPHIPVMEPTPKAMNAPLSVFHTPTQEGTFHLPASTQTHESPRSVASVQTPKMEVTVVGTQTMTEPVLDIKPEPVDVVEPISAPRPLSPIFSARPLSPTIIELPSVPKNEPSVAAIPILEEYPTPAAVPVPIPVRPFTPEMQQSPSILPASLLTRPALTPAPLSAAFVEDVNVPDGTTFPPGAEFIKSWKMVNDGNTEWSADTVLAFVGGDRMGAFKNAPTQYEVGRVPAGESIDVWAADLKAPEDSGVYSSFWRLRNGPEGDFFGHRLWVSIEVAAPSHSDSSSSPSLASSTLAMPGAFFQAPSDVPTIASTPAHPTVPSTTTSVITPATISSQDESVSFIDSVSEDGSVVEIPVAATSSQAAPTTSASAATLTSSPAPRPASPNDEDGFIVVYDSASSTDGM